MAKEIMTVHFLTTFSMPFTQPVYWDFGEKYLS